MYDATAQRLRDVTEALHGSNEVWAAIDALWRPYVLQNDVEAQFRLAYYYLFCGFDEGPTTRDEMEMLLRTAAEHNHPDAVYWLSHLSPHGSAEQGALLLRAGELGSLEAQRDLGALYATGDWSGPRDPVRGAEWYRRAAERGHANAQYNLGFMYLRGEGVSSDPVEGLRWIRLAGDQREPASCRLLAELYRFGHYGISIDPGEADRWDDLYQQLQPASKLSSDEK